MPRRPPVVRFLKTGQPIIRTARGTSFGTRKQALGPFEKAGNEITMGMIDGLAEVAIDVMEESLIQCPVDTGALKRSARFRLDQEIGGNVDIVMGYGFGDEVNTKTRRSVSDYAVPVHEITEAKHDPPTKARFLEDPLLEHAASIEPHVAQRIKAFLMTSGKNAPSAEFISSGARLIFEEK